MDHSDDMVDLSDDVEDNRVHMQEGNNLTSLGGATV